MSVPKKSGIVFLFAGTVLVLSALSLFLYNRYEDARAGQEAESLLHDVQTIITAKEPPSTTLDSAMPVKETEGYKYVGYLSIPDLELELPVMSEWDYEKLKICPCRHFGSSRTDDLVIAAHNYKQHFGYLYRLEVGDPVSFTDMEGIKNLYEVARIETLNPTEVEAVQNSGYDLVLYTCTYSSKTRVAVFCDRHEDTSSPLSDKKPENMRS